MSEFGDSAIPVFLVVFEAVLPSCDESLGFAHCIVAEILAQVDGDDLVLLVVLGVTDGLPIWRRTAEPIAEDGLAPLGRALVDPVSAKAGKGSSATHSAASAVLMGAISVVTG